MVNAEQTYGTCDSCGTTSTLPKVSDEQRANFFNRANHFRRQNEFDKALSAYENILNVDTADAEAHWGVVLSRYGIEYVNDPSTGKKVPTCHRAQLDSILSDADYLAALDHAADGYTRSLYEEEAKVIAQLQKGILDISSKEEPYDVFICYKETSEAGTRTKDSTLAQDVYYQLTSEGHKVFFSRITLEKKLGQEYEPYIFAALNSAKVMVVIGTSAENFNAVWVKNEWSRFLALMKKERSKLLIPCYMDMDVYDLPEALSMLQSQDMSKIGFMQDLIRGIHKVLDAGKVKTLESTAGTEAPVAPGVSSLLERGKLFLEDKNWSSANEYFDRVLDIDPKCAPAYMGKVCAALNVTAEEELITAKRKLTEFPDYEKALRFANTEEKQRWNEYFLENTYTQLLSEKKNPSAEDNLYLVAEKLYELGDYKDAQTHAKECEVLAQEATKEKIIKKKKEKIQLTVFAISALVLFIVSLFIIILA